MDNTATARPSLLMRNDTLLGICEGLGEDLGISGNWFRIAFALALFFSPVMTVAAYFAAGAVVLGTRLLVPVPRKATEVVDLPGKPQIEARDEDEEALLLAA